MDNSIDDIDFFSLKELELETLFYKIDYCERKKIIDISDPLTLVYLFEKDSAYANKINFTSFKS